MVRGIFRRTASTITVTSFNKGGAEITVSAPTATQIAGTSGSQTAVNTFSSFPETYTIELNLNDNKLIMRSGNKVAVLSNEISTGVQRLDAMLPRPRANTKQPISTLPIKSGNAFVATAKALAPINSRFSSSQSAGLGKISIDLINPKKN